MKTSILNTAHSSTPDMNNILEWIRQEDAKLVEERNRLDRLWVSKMKSVEAEQHTEVQNPETIAPAPVL